LKPGENLRLILLRHAKSDWADKSLDDHDRPLNTRGRAAAPRIGAYMRERKYIPRLVLCSSAKRTRETLALLLPYFTPAPEVRYLRHLYLAEWRALLGAVREAPRAATPLLIVGHNPGMEQLAAELAAKPGNAAERARTEKAAEKFSTGALAVFDFAGSDWRGAKPRLGRLADFARPRDLPGAPENEA